MLDQSKITKNVTGDATVTIDSLTKCGMWETLQSEPVEIYSFPGVEHDAIVTDVQVIKQIISIITSD